ncbi:hypothetical protein MPUL_00050 [Mycolicibacterium pulveris]|uniref:Uncharacterized protein n=1 Tax=Mycolicibacterium pulveris TaxID=36813 RepID=A0A7I7UC82_MYCPV|nr:hypothetical protein [Mycolicibacterium pulveris]BBY78847.1 hypothetical protein MPUL_00050 [Mycolicibacterium pulveris]
MLRVVFAVGVLVGAALGVPVGPAIITAYADPAPVVDQFDQRSFPCQEDEVLGYAPQFGPDRVGCIHIEDLTPVTADGSQQAVPDVGAASPRLQDVIAERFHGERWLDPSSLEDFAEIAADAARDWREACMIRTVEQLDALPAGAVIRVGRGGVLQRGRSGWFSPGFEVGQDGEDLVESGAEIVLVWHPDWSDQ